MNSFSLSATYFAIITLPAAAGNVRLVAILLQQQRVRSKHKKRSVQTNYKSKKPKIQAFIKVWTEWQRQEREHRYYRKWKKANSRNK